MKELLLTIIKQAGDIALENLENFDIRYKNYKDLVTSSDVEIEEFLRRKILEKYPNHNIVSEESDEIDSKSDFTWVIDPIDGTANYAHRYPFFCVSIGILKDKKPHMGAVYAPYLKEMFFAELGKGAYLNNKKLNVTDTDQLDKSLIFYLPGITPEILDKRVALERVLIPKVERIRGLGALALEIAYVAAGRADAVFRFEEGAKIWDYAAGAIILEEAGGHFSDAENNEIDFSKTKADFIATNSKIHAQLLDIIKKNN